MSSHSKTRLEWTSDSAGFETLGGQNFRGVDDPKLTWALWCPSPAESYRPTLGPDLGRHDDYTYQAPAPVAKAAHRSQHSPPPCALCCPQSCSALIGHLV